MPRLRTAVFYTTADDPPVVHPALIAVIHPDDGTVDVDVFVLEETGPRRVRRVPYGWGPHTWCYHPAMERDKNKP